MRARDDFATLLGCAAPFRAFGGTVEKGRGTEGAGARCRLPAGTVERL
ncbi:hypothetical protein [Streptomyces clavifer]|nr:hypothetical protein OG388_34425 [Streptomyces clavifer]